MTYDVIIVGGGPAGSVAGLNLAKRGLRIGLLDRAQFPRLKPCGGGISYRVFKRFPYLKDVLDTVPKHYVKKLVMESPSGDVVECAREGPLYVMIRRWEFDAALLQACKHAGLDVHENSKVTDLVRDSDGIALETASGASFRTKLVIGADGVNSTIAVKSGLRTGWADSQAAIDTSEETPNTALSCEPETMWVYYGIGRRRGYGYVFPKAEHINAGIGFLMSEMKSSAKHPKDEHAEFIEFLKRRKVVSGESQATNLHAYPLPMGGFMERKTTDRLLLAGDAAGFVNGFTAEGIYYAMVSGELAASTALEAVDQQQFGVKFLNRYDKACEMELGEELRKSVEIQQRILGHPERIDRIVRLAAQDTRVRDLLTDYSLGLISYRKFRRGMLPKTLALLRG